MSLDRRLISLESVPDVRPLADHGLLFTFGDRIETGLSQQIVRLAGIVADQAIPGVVDMAPSYTTLLLLLDPAVADRKRVTSQVCEQWSELSQDRSLAEDARPEVVVPVEYGGASGPDLVEVARSSGLSPQEVIDRHSGASYRVGAIGFAPGFAFLIGLPPELATPRRSTPRTRVPAGSVGIGGAQTGIYSLPTPGGWSLIGRTAIRMFDPEREPASLLQAGDRVRFEPVSGLPGETSAPTSRLPRLTQPEASRDAFEILSPGLQTTVQDLGRTGYGQMGVAPGGAADRAALIAGNRLLGNDDGAAGLEMTLSGPAIRFLRPGRIALTGANLGGVLNEMRMPSGAVRVVGPGDELTFDPDVPRPGTRSYLCVAGGIDVPERLGSRSTDLNAVFGGHEGRPLRPGDRLRVGAARNAWRPGETGSSVSIRRVLRVVAGPHRARFSDRIWSRFLNDEFTVSSSSNRMGARLDGPLLTPEGGADIISEGMVTGAIQVTGQGQPIVMLPARATIGGYPKIAVVIAADLDALGQLRPGDRIRFEAIELDD